MLIALLFLTACASPPPVFKPITVDVPVTTPCIVPAIAEAPSALQQIPPTASIFDKVKATLIEIDNRKAYEARLEAALNTCSQP